MPVDDRQPFLLLDVGFDRLYRGMPEFCQEDMTPAYQVLVSFVSKADLEAFATLIDAPMTEKTKSVWFPPQKPTPFMDKRYAYDDNDDQSA